MDFNPAENYEIDRSHLDKAHSRQTTLGIFDTMFWLISGTVPQVIVSSINPDGTLEYDMFGLPSRFESAARQVQDEIDKIFEQLANAKGVERAKLVRAVEVVSRTMAPWIKALKKCTATEEGLTEAFDYVAAKLPIACQIDLQSDAAFGNFVHEIQMHIASVLDCGVDAAGSIAA